MDQSHATNANVKLMAPDVGAIVEYGLDGLRRQPARYRVEGWLRTAPRPTFDPNDWIGKILFEGCREFVDGKRLQWCHRDKAEFLSLSGVSGAIAPIAECKVVGIVSWSTKDIDEARASAVRMADRGLMLF